MIDDLKGTGMIHPSITHTFLDQVRLEASLIQRTRPSWLLPSGVTGAYVDGTHPTSHGFAIMSERLAPQLSSLRLSAIQAQTTSPASRRTRERPR